MQQCAINIKTTIIPRPSTVETAEILILSQIHNVEEVQGSAKQKTV